MSTHKPSGGPSKGIPPPSRTAINNGSFNTPKNAHLKLTAACLVFLSVCFTWTFRSSPVTSFSANESRRIFSVKQQQDILGRCAAIRAEPGPPADFLVGRDKSDRFEPGTNATLIRNANIFTGEKNGTVFYRGDILLDKGIIRAIGDIPGRVIENTPNLTTVEANGAWVTPGLGMLHQCIGSFVRWLKFFTF
jgi:hypothetical protein